MANRRAVRQGETGRIEESPQDDFDAPVPFSEPPTARNVNSIPAVVNEPDPIEDRGEAPKVKTSAHKFLSQRIVDIMREVEYVQKREPDGTLKFPTVAIADVIQKLRAPMIRAGVLLLPGKITQVYHQQVKTRTSEMVLTEIVQRFVLSNVDDPSDQYVFEVIGAGTDSMDKGCAKAFTAAFKAALLKAFMIETGEEMDSPQNNNSEAPDPGELYYISDQQIAELRDLCAKAGVEESLVASSYNAQRLEDIVENDFPQARARLEQRLKNAGASRGAPARK